MKLKSIILGFRFLAVILSPAAFADDCKVPVCDIPAKIAEMKTKGQGFRFDTVAGLRKIARASKDMAVEQNLIDFGTQALQLSQDLGDESWMVGECQGLLDQARMGVLKYGPIVADDMIKLYDAQSGETAHFEVLTYWRNQIPGMDNPDSIRNIIRFGAGAQQISKGRGESEYIAKEAGSLTRDATSRYGIVDPTHEGAYKATLKNSAKGDQDYRMIVLETTSTSGLLVGFVETTSNKLTYLFPNAFFNQDLTELSADSVFDGYTSKFDFRYDRNAGTYTGWIRDTRYPEDIGMQSTLIRSPGEYYHGAGAQQPPKTIALRDLEGQYEAKIGTVNGIINIKRFGPKLFAADFYEINAEDNRNEIKYQTGYYNTVSNVLTLIRIENDEISQKLTLAFRKMDDSGAHPKLDGFNYGMNNKDPQVADLTWKREADDERPDPNWPGKKK